MILCYITYKSDCSAECIVQKGSHSFSSTFHVADLLDLRLATGSGESMLCGFQSPFDYFAHCIQSMVCLFFPVPVNHTIGVVLHDVDVSQIPVAEPNLTRWPFCRW